MQRLQLSQALQGAGPKVLVVGPELAAGRALEVVHKGALHGQQGASAAERAGQPPCTARHSTHLCDLLGDLALEGIDVLGLHILRGHGQVCSTGLHVGRVTTARSSRSAVRRHTTCLQEQREELGRGLGGVCL